MTDVVTLTMNPSIDILISVERVVPFHKLRCAAQRRDAGGGGIHVARVMKRLGANVRAIYPAGGVLGELLRRLVEQEGVPGFTTPRKRARTLRSLRRRTAGNFGSFFPARDSPSRSGARALAR
jgi:fructose-1-phosphate kinase PfkB-like protein